jgi:hypothetical protein
VAAFYPLPRRHFQQRGFIRSYRFGIHILRLCFCSEVEKIVHRVTEILFAAEIAFRRLNGCMAQQELNLLQLASAAVAQLGARSPQVMRRDMFQARSFAAGLHDVPHDIL